MDVRIDREGGNLEDVAHYDACRLVAYAGKAFEFFEGLRDFAAELFDEFLGKVVDVDALRVEETARLDDFGDAVDAELDHGGRGLGGLEKDFRYLVYADVGALRAEYDRDQHRVGAAIVQRDRRIREKFVQLSSNESNLVCAFHNNP